MAGSCLVERVCRAGLGRWLTPPRRWASRGSAPTAGWPGSTPRARPAWTTGPPARTTARRRPRSRSRTRSWPAPAPSAAGRTGSVPSWASRPGRCRRVLRRHQVPYLRECDPLTGEVIRASKTTAVRYERDRPGELVHIDVKKIGKIPDGGGWRAHGRAMGSTGAKKRARIGYDYVHSMVDDHSRLAYCEILPDEKGPPAPRSSSAPPSYFAGHGITTHRAGHHRQPLQLPQEPRRQGGRDRTRRHAQVHPAALPLAERQGRTVQPHPGHRVGLPAGLHLSNAERAAALAPWLEYYNTRRRHTALGGLPPISRLSPT